MEKPLESRATGVIEKSKTKGRFMGKFTRAVLGTIALLAVIVLGFFLLRGPGVIFVEEALAEDLRYLGGSLPIEFTIATYNVQGRPLMDDTRGKFPEIGSRLEPFDIIGFQELFVNHDLLWGAMDHPVKVFDGTLRSRFKLVGPGLSTVGRFPLMETVQMHFTSKGEFQNRVASKGILLTRFNIGGHTVDVYNTHMEAGSSAEAAEARYLQVEELAAFVGRNSPPEHSVIFLGDFNMRPLRDYHTDADIDSKLLGFQLIMEGLGEGFRDASDEINGIPVSLTAENYDAPWRRSPGSGEDIDRILFRPGTGVSLEPLHWEKHVEAFRADSGEPLSDHDLVSVRFRLEILR